MKVMNKNNYLKLVLLLSSVIISCSSKSQNIDDVLLEGKIMEMDSPRIFSIRGKGGYAHNYCFLHLKIKTTKGDSITSLVRVFNMHTEAAAYAAGDNLKIGDVKKFRVFIFSPCECGLPRVDGHCEGDEYFPIESKVLKSYSTINRIISYD